MAARQSAEVTRALAMIARGMTPYAAAMKVGIALSTIYRALKRHRETKLQTAIIAACEFLDPQRQGDGWPDPISWDGRTLAEQAHDIAVLLDVAAEAAEYDCNPRRAEEAKALSKSLWSRDSR